MNTAHMTLQRTIYPFFPRYICGKWYWQSSPVTYEYSRVIIHGKADGCSKDIVHFNDLRIVSKLERALK